jgi:alpha-amylase
MMPVCLYFQVHQPYRLRRFGYFDVGSAKGYFDAEENRRILSRVAEKCYRPAAEMLIRLTGRFAERFGVSLSLSGTLLEQLRDGEPETLDAFRSLARSGRAEILSETSHHSLAWLHSSNEFLSQVARHRDLVGQLLGVRPRVFRNTELIYSDELARFVEELGYDAILGDGASGLLLGRSPDHVYRPSGARRLRLLLRNGRLSDDVAFRFSDRGWSDWPLTAEKFLGWLAASAGRADVVNLFMDFETLGEHQWRDFGIFDFFERLAEGVVASGGRFVTVSQASQLPPRGIVEAPTLSSWADAERDVSAWQGNDLQKDALRAIAALEGPVKASRSAELLEDWRRLTTSDHFYYMATKDSSDGEVHGYFSPWESPYEAYMSFMHVAADLERRARLAAGAGVVSRAPAERRSSRSLAFQTA